LILFCFVGNTMNPTLSQGLQEGGWWGGRVMKISVTGNRSTAPMIIKVLFFSFFLPVRRSLRSS